MEGIKFRSLCKIFIMSNFSYFVFHVHSTSSSISLANCRLGEMFFFSF